MYRIFINFSDEKPVHVLLHASGRFTFSTNSKILRQVIKFHATAERVNSFLKRIVEKCFVISTMNTFIRFQLTYLYSACYERYLSLISICLIQFGFQYAYLVSLKRVLEIFFMIKMTKKKIDGYSLLLTFPLFLILQTYI